MKQSTVCHYDGTNKIFFIDRNIYNSLLGKDISTETLISELFNKNSLISLETKKEILYLNNMLHEGVLNQYSAVDVLDYLTERDMSILNKSYRYKYIDSDYFNVKEKYYEFKLLPNNFILVIIEPVFVKKITESKVELIGFFLKFLCFLNQYSLNAKDLLKRLIAIRIYDFNFITLKNALL